MTIRTCLFDMGNVLVYFSHDVMCRNLAELCRCPAEDIVRFLLTEGRQEGLETGTLAEEQFLSELREVTGANPTSDEVFHAVSDIFTLNESILYVLNSLKQQGIRLVLLSNTCEAHLRFIESRFDILNQFDERIVSCRVGAMKPHPSIYQAALNAAQADAAETFYTDDIAEYIEAAKAVDIRAFRYTTTDQLIEDLATVGITIPNH